MDARRRLGNRTLRTRTSLHQPDSDNGRKRQEKEYSSVLIFSSTKQKVKEMHRDLMKAGLQIKSIHSDLEQDEREDVLRSFRSKQTQILVATDILSRGIDIEDIGLVINYDLPNDAEDYIHRIGRTARASSKGEAITFINEYDQHKFHKIEELIEKVQEKVFKGLNMLCHKLPIVIVFQSFVVDDFRVQRFSKCGNNAPVSGNSSFLLTIFLSAKTLYFQVYVPPAVTAPAHLAPVNSQVQVHKVYDF